MAFVLRRSSALPALFVVMWCGGYISGSIGTRTAPPLAFTFWRFVIAATVLAAVAVMTRAPWPRTVVEWRNLALTGLSLQALFYSTGYLGMSLGVPAGLSALLGGVAPLAVAAAGVVFLGERLTVRQWTGSLLGVAGVVLAVLDRLGQARLGVGIAFTLLGVVGFTTGTILQRRNGAAMDLRTGGAVQFGVAALAVLPLAALHGGLTLPGTPAVAGSLLYVSLGNSVGATSLLYLLLRRRNAAQATSLLYLVPPLTALIGAALLGQALGPATWVGLVVATAGVVLTTNLKTKHPLTDVTNQAHASGYDEDHSLVMHRREVLSRLPLEAGAAGTRFADHL
jgi:drug/metabolite transporter (DMT)-like permease